MELSKVFQLNPLNTISSGAMLIALGKKKAQDLIDLLKKNGIMAFKIGQFEPKNKGKIQPEVLSKSACEL